MSDPATTAACAVTFIAPYLVAAGTAAAKTLGEEAAGAGARLLGWLRGKLAGRAKEALARLEADPGDRRKQAALELELEETLKAQPELLAELRGLLESLPAREEFHQKQEVSGAGAKAVQIGKGHGNKVRM